MVRNQRVSLEIGGHGERWRGDAVRDGGVHNQRRRGTLRNGESWSEFGRAFRKMWGAIRDVGHKERWRPRPEIGGHRRWRGKL